MGLCKCLKRKVTNQFCFGHRVNVCELCMLDEHKSCIVESYLNWLGSSDCVASCKFCNQDLSDEACVRLTCYHVFHWVCLDNYARQLPASTALTGYTCPSCNDCLFPPENLLGPVADALRETLKEVNWARAGLGLPLLDVEIMSRYPAILNYRSKAYNVCREFLQGSWKAVKEEDFKIQRISGGLSNHIFRCSLPADTKQLLHLGEPSDVLFRFYGRDNKDEKEDQSSNVVFTMLSERGLGPRLYGVFPEGRLEEFIPSRAMLRDEVMSPEYSEVIAIKMAKVHGMSAPINKEGSVMNKMLRRYQSQIETMSLADVDPEYRELAKNLLEFDFAAEIEWLQRYLSRVQSPIVFCHNDVQGGNILLREEDEEEETRSVEDRIMLIDFEFCGYNYRAFDLANHFCEWIYDYTNKEFPYYHCRRSDFPSKERMIEFLRVYLANVVMENPTSQNSSLTMDSLADNMNKEVRPFLLAPSLMWCMWAIVNSKNAKIKFGYWNYATDRMTDYNTFKKDADCQMEPLQARGLKRSCEPED